MSRIRNLLVTGALLPVLALGLVAQEEGSDRSASEEPDPRDEFVEVVDVDIVNVDVVVQDADGRFVEGLTAEDFRLFEDGRQVELTNFHAVRSRERAPVEIRRATLPEPGEEDDWEPTPDARKEEATSAPPGPGSDPVWVVVYLDNRFLRPFDRNKVVRQVRGFLRREIDPGDKVMVASFDRSLNVRQPFTDDLQLVMDELFEAEELSALQVESDTDRSDVLRRISGARNSTEAFNHADFHAKRIHNELGASLDAMRELLDQLGGLPGRKVMVHVSNGLPLTAGEDVFAYYDQLYPDEPFSGHMAARRYDAGREFQQLITAANTHRVVFYTFEGRGLKSHSSLSADQGTVSRDGFAQGSTIDIDFTRLMNEQEPLILLAERTGGVATVGTNNLSLGLDQLASDLRSYYSLGYASGAARDGRYHKLEVEVADPRAKKIRHRAGFRGQDISERVSDSTLAALHHGFESNPLDVELVLGSPMQTEKSDRYLVPVEVKIPIGSLTLLPRGENHLARLRISLAALDVDGGSSGVSQTEIPLVIPDEEVEAARGKDWVYEAQLLMRRGHQSVAAGVRDELAGNASFMRRSITVGR